MRRRSFWSVMGVGLVLGLAGIALHFGLVAWAGHRIDMALDTLGRQPRLTGREQAADEAVDRRMAARQLTGDLQCVAGTVVAVDLKAHSATQLLGSDWRPIPCHGRYADAPLPRRH